MRSLKRILGFQEEKFGVQRIKLIFGDRIGEFMNKCCGWQMQIRVKVDMLELDFGFGKSFGLSF